MRELYVYYRIRDETATAARVAVASMQRELAAMHRGLVARLLTRRRDDGSTTWMETYALDATGAGTGIDARIEASITAHASALSSFIEGPRHVEAFDFDGKG
jgi:hypothetical protein